MKKILIAVALLSLGTTLVNAMNEQQSDPAKMKALMEKMRQERREAQIAARQAGLASPEAAKVTETPVERALKARKRALAPLSTNY